MPDYSSREIIRRLENNCFILQRVKGSHHIFKHANGKRVVVPHLEKGFAKGDFLRNFETSRIGIIQALTIFATSQQTTNDKRRIERFKGSR